ncbi:MAG: DNA polymerase III subunit alpha [Candidatus Dormibacteria bacterium]
MEDPVRQPDPGALQPFVNLHTHTEYSLLDGAARIGELVAAAKAMGQPAVAMTDHGNLYGAVEFYTAARDAGINPIIGCEVYVTRRSRHQKEAREDRDPWHLVLLARDQAGYRNLVQLVSRAQTEGFYQKPRIDKQLLAEHAQGLIGLSACIGGELPQAILGGDLDAAEAVAREHAEILGRDNYFLELQDHGIPEEAPIRDGLAELSRRLDLPLVATNDSHYIAAEDAEAHDILLCLQTGARQSEEKRFRFHGPHFYLASGTEMGARFRGYAEAVANTVEIARRCQVELSLGHNLLPTYSPIPNGYDADSYLTELCARGLHERYGDSPSPAARQRLEMELGVIRETGFAAYFLIVWDLIRAGRSQGVKVGPGRGSAAGSIVAYVLRVTNVCPLRYGLIFERFLNIERLSMPDIDIDFDDKRRDRVLQYVTDKYGPDRVAQIITFGTMAARVAIRDVGRVLEVPLADTDRLAKLVPQSVGITLERALKQTPELRELYENNDWARRTIDIAKRLEGICRNASTHAAGVVIAPEPLTNLVPVQRSTNDKENVVTQFDMHGVSKIGLLKVDFLGLANLTVIDDCCRALRLGRGIDIDIDEIPLDDPATYQLLGRADTHGVFQMEMGGAKRILLDMQPTCLEDISVAGALNRPGPIEGGVIELYMKRKRGEEQVTYAIPELEEILAESYGTIVYQDQVMKIANAVAGFSLGESDVLRAAMGKKDKQKMAQQRVKFVAGAAARGVSEESAVELFELMAFFAGYGFNKAHSVAYGLISYQTAYLKANHPLEYMAALLNSKGGDFDKVKQTILDCHARGLTVRPPDLNRSQAEFSVGDAEHGEILYGLAHIKNVGDRIVEVVVEAREQGGPFTNLLDLCLRVGSRDLNRRVLEALICSGACDPLGERSVLLAVLDRAMERAAQIRRERESGQTALFGGDATPPSGAESVPPPEAFDHLGALPAPDPDIDGNRLRWERELLGMYLSDHPLRKLTAELGDRSDATVSELGPHLDGLTVQLAGAVRDVRAFVPKSRAATGERMAFLQLEDLTGTCEVVVFTRTFSECVQLLKPDAVIVVRGRVESTGRRGGAAPAAGGEEELAPESAPAKLVAETVFALDDPRLLAWKRDRTVHLMARGSSSDGIGALRRVFDLHPGDAGVVLHVEAPDRVDEIALAERYSVDAGPAFERAVTAILGERSYRVETRREAAPERQPRNAGLRRA